MLKDRLAREIGSEFHWVGLPKGPYHQWPQPNVTFALGRGVLAAICRKHRSGAGTRALHVPDYFCRDVVQSLQREGVAVRFYADDPRWLNPQWESLRPKRGDLVLAVNYFGVRDGSVWGSWSQENRGVVMIEDHTHDPASKWALTSNADFAFASLRKTLPVTDGAIVWSPRGRALPHALEGSDSFGSALKLAAMVLKTAHLAGTHRDSSLKTAFRRLQVDGETAMIGAIDAGVSAWNRSVLSGGFPKSWRRKREANVRCFLEMLAGSKQAASLFGDWPGGHCPFNGILVCASDTLRERLRMRLVRADIYAAVHWPLAPGTSDHAIELAGRILTIPLDQRYDLQDVERIVKVIRSA